MYCMSSSLAFACMAGTSGPAHGVGVVLGLLQDADVAAQGVAQHFECADHTAVLPAPLNDRALVGTGCLAGPNTVDRCADRLDRLENVTRRAGCLRKLALCRSHRVDIDAHLCRHYLNHL